MPDRPRAKRRHRTGAPREVLLRGLAVLEALNRRQVSRLESLATDTDLPKPTVNRLLAVLARAGYARRLPKRRGYTLDDGVLRLSRGYGVEEAIVKAAIGVMRSFTTKYRWPLAIGTRDGNAMRVREVTVGMSPLSAGGDESFLGRRIGFFHSALGRAYLAFCPDEERREILAVLDSMARTRPAPPEIQHAARILRQAVRSGYAISAPLPGEPAVGLAVPIRHDGRVVACLSLRYLGRAMPQEQVVRRYLAPLQQAAVEIAALARQAG
jgi:IclR family mhp operon transcriptional activator